MRLAIVTKMLSPYRNPVFADLGGRSGVDLLVLTFSEDQAHRQWNLEDLYADRSFACERLGREKTTPAVWHALRRFDPHAVVIGGYDSLECMAALWYCRRHGRSAVLWSGSTARSVRRRFLARPLRRKLIQAADAYVAYGTLARDFLIQNGAQSEKIFTGYNTVDIAFFMRAAEAARHSSQFSLLRSRFGPLSLLYVGRMIEGKGLRHLLAALDRLGRDDFSLVLVGDGPLRPALERQARKLRFRSFFEGFQHTAVLPLYYACCDLLVFPTLNDLWGLVINEAMACGKPVVSSTEAGASYDLVQNGRNGWVVDPRNPGEWARVLGELMADPQTRERMGQESLRIIQHFTPTALASALLCASRQA